MQASSLVRLVTDARAGDTRSRDALFARAAKLAYARAARQCDDPDATWDITQEALEAAVRGLPALREPEAFLAWLGAIVDRSAGRYIRRQACRHEADLSEAEALDSGTATPHRLAEEADTLRQVRAAMGCLPPRDRLIVELFYFDDMTCREVAGFLKTTRGAVKMSLHRSRRQLREEMVIVHSRASEAVPAGPEVPAVAQVMSSGPSKAISDSVVFGATSFTARCYMALYPRGDAVAAARRAEVDLRQMEEQVAWLQERTIVACEGELWRCTMPVMLSRDMELIRPWAAELAAPVVAALEPLRAVLEGIAAGFDPGPAQDTVLAVGLHAEVARRPIWRLIEALGAAPTQRAGFGECTAAAVAKGVAWPRGYVGGLGSGFHHRDDPPLFTREYALGPEGTDKSRLGAFLSALGEPDAGDLTRGLRGLLCSLAYDPITIDQVADRAAQYHLRVKDVDWFIGQLVGLQGVTVEEGGITLRVPVIPAGQWEPFVARLQALGEDILVAVPAAVDDLRDRMLRCSFADCNFQDSAALCIGLVADLVAEAINETGWVRFPAEAGLEWGLAFVV